MFSNYRQALLCIGLFFLSPVASQQPVPMDDTHVYGPLNPSGIQFSSGWNTAKRENADRRYEGTYTWTQEAGANLIYFFRGMSLA